MSSDQTIHFIGIGGSGMAPLAELAHARGMRVRGSDPGHGYAIDRLKNLGIEIFSEHREENISGASRIVYSSAIRGDNPEMVVARRNRVKLLHRSDFLKEMMVGYKPIVIAGTHGKTSTTAMIGHMLHVLGLEPVVVVGGTMNEYGTSLLNGKGKYFVVEADESDGTFLKYEPHIAVVTNIDQDHLDYYKNIGQLNEAFLKFISKVPADEGFAILGWDDANIRAIAPKYSGAQLAFGFFLGSAVRCLRHKQNGSRLTFHCIVEHDQITCDLPCLGRHNVQNALAALSVARALGLDIKKASAALESYPGVARRLSLYELSPSVTLVDDYAHNPGKVAAAIQAVRDAFTDRQLIVVFQPHRFSRLQTMYRETVSAFSAANQVFVLPVYSAGESNDDRFTPGEIAKDIERQSKVRAAGSSDFEFASKNILKDMSSSPSKKYVVMTVGAGDVWKLGKLIQSNF